MKRLLMLLCMALPLFGEARFMVMPGTVASSSTGKLYSYATVFLRSTDQDVVRYRITVAYATEGAVRIVTRVVERGSYIGYAPYDSQCILPTSGDTEYKVLNVQVTEEKDKEQVQPENGKEY